MNSKSEPSKGSNHTEGQPDVTLIVEGDRIPCHKKILMDASSYFKAMFSCNMKESVAKEIEMKETSASVLKILIQYAYTRKLDLTLDNAFSLLTAASMFHFEEAVNECSHFLLPRISHDTCLDIMYVAQSCALRDLYGRAKRYSLWYFKYVIEKDEFLLLSLEQLVDYLCSDMLNVKSEVDVFNALVRWTGFDSEDRMRYFPQVFQKLHLESMNCDELRTLANHEFVRNNLLCAKTVQTILDQTAEHKGSSSARVVPVSLWILGGDIVFEDKNKWNSQILKLTPDTKRLEEGISVPFLDEANAIGCKACVVGRNLYVFGGTRRIGSTDWLHDVWCYDSFDDHWQIVTTLRQPRRHHSVLVWNDSVYLVGGFGRHRIMLDTVDKYDTETGEWESLPPLRQAVYLPATCLCQDTIYVIKNDIECYKPGFSCWTTITVALPFENGLHTAMCQGDIIYLIGGFGHLLVAFDTSNKSFSQVGRFSEASGVGCLHNDKIYVLGGSDSKSIEMYDLKAKQFKVVCDMECCLHNPSLVVMPTYPKFR